MSRFCKAIICCALFVCQYSYSYSQKNSMVVTANPFSFIEPDAGFTPGFEYFITNKVSVLTDAGIIFYTPSNQNTLAYDARNSQFGYKFKPELRYYTRAKGVADGFFISVEFLYKHVRYNRYDGVPVTDNMGNFVYTDYSGYKIIKDVLGASGKIGVRNYFGKKNKLGIDFYLGLGYRFKKFQVKDLPPGGNIDEGPFTTFQFDPTWTEGPAVSLPAGIKLIWRLR